MPSALKATPEVVVEALGRTQEPAHGPTAHQHDVVGVARPVPQQGHQAFEGVQLDVVDAVADRLLLHGEHPQRIERRQRFGRSGGIACFGRVGVGHGEILRTAGAAMVRSAAEGGTLR